MSEKIYGDITPLRPRQIQQLRRLFDRKLGSNDLVTQEFATQLTWISSEINAIVAVLVDRSGRVREVMVGDDRRVYLPDVGRARVKSTRFRGLRLIRTVITPERDETPISDDDITDLTRLRLDAVVVVVVGPGGYPGATHWIHLLPPNPENYLYSEHKFRIPAEIDLKFEPFISELEAEFERKSVDLTDISDDPAILVHINLPNDPNRRDPKTEIDEMQELCRTAGVYVAEVVTQNRQQIHPKYAVGSGKLDEITRSALRLGVDLIIFSQDLLARQVFAIAERTDLRVIDRTQLILDIFAAHATTSDARTQVELAQLKYNLPRLSTKNTGMSRLTGGIGGRGPGETKLEINKRRANDRIKKLTQKIRDVSDQRKLQRKLRKNNELPVAAIVGYTNAGKSTLLNRLTNSEVIEEDKLFATLRPTSRSLHLPSGKQIIITDTVGFIHDLPKDLVNAFKATLEELEEADLLIHVVDASSEGVEERIAAVQEILKSLQMHEKQQLILFNKIDRVDLEEVALLVQKYDAIPICALDTDTTLPVVKKALETRLFDLNLLKDLSNQNRYEMIHLNDF